MSQDNMVKMECTVCKKPTHFTKKNKQKLRGHRLELKKGCKFCKVHTLQKETK